MRHILTILIIVICNNSFAQILTVDTVKSRVDYLECINHANVTMKYIEQNDFKNLKGLLINSSNSNVFTNKYLKEKVNWGYELIRKFGMPKIDKTTILSIKTTMQDADNKSFIYNEDVSITFSFKDYENKNPDKIVVICRKKDSTFILEGVEFINRKEMQKLQDLINNAASPND